MTRTVGDAALMFAAIVGPDPRDPWSLNAALKPVSPLLQGQQLTGVRFGYIERMANKVLDREVRANTEASLKALEALGAEIEPVAEAIDWIEYEGRVLYQTGIAARMKPRMAEWRGKMDPSMVQFADWGEGFSMLDLRNAEYARTGLYHRVQKLLSQYDFLVSPATARARRDLHATQPVIIEAGPAASRAKAGPPTSTVQPHRPPGDLVPSGFASDGLPTDCRSSGAGSRPRAARGRAVRAGAALGRQAAALLMSRRLNRRHDGHILIGETAA